MGISKPIVSEIAYRTYAINEFGMAAAFVLLGQERGLVIDTGCGMYDLRQIVDQLCKLPYDVVISHGHGDHIGSMDSWEEVWLHPADWEAIGLEHLEQNRERLKGYPEMMAAFGSFEAYDISPEQIRYPEKLPKLLPLEDGQIFDLGGRKVEVVHTPGHTAGECAFIDPFSRILFSGDACNVNLGLRAASVNTALKGLLKLKAREGQFDRNYNSHIGYGKDTVNRSMPESVLDDCLHILRGILNGTSDVQYKEAPARMGGGQIGTVRYGAVLITFDPNRLIDGGEEKAE